MTRNIIAGKNKLIGKSIEDLSFDYYDPDGRLVRRELDRVLLSKRHWATMMFLYQDLYRKTGAWLPPKIALVRFRKSYGKYRVNTVFRISSARQARQIVDVIRRWYGAELGEDSHE